MQNLENRHSYFRVILKPSWENTREDNIKEIMEDAMEPVLQKMNASGETYVIHSKNGFGESIFMFKSKDRKRVSLLRNTLNKHLGTISPEDFEITNPKRAKEFAKKIQKPQLKSLESLTRKIFLEEFLKYKRNDNYLIKGEDFQYRGKDLEIFQDKKNWRPWQKKMYEIIFTDYGSIKEASDREIIFIEDTIGSSGKSKWMKYLYTCDSENVGLLTEASMSQLKANIVNLGSKKIYLIDLPRTPGDVGYTGLMNSLESLKNGLVNSSMYGGTGVLVSTPPWVIICGNKMPEGNWTPDRWVVYSITKNYDWKDISKERRKVANDIIKIENEIKEQSLGLKKAKLQNIKEKIKKVIGVS